mgnify:CR=1 FL=1
MSNLSVNDFTAGDVITASAMNTNFATIENYVNTSPGLAKLTGSTFTGLLTANAGVTVSGTTTTGVINASGLVTLSGGLTIEDGDTFTFNGVGLTAIQTGGEALADNDTSIMTAGHIIDEFVQSGTDGGTTIYVASSEPSSGLKTNDIWLDTSS